MAVKKRKKADPLVKSTRAARKKALELEYGKGHADGYRSGFADGESEGHERGVLQGQEQSMLRGEQVARRELAGRMEKNLTDYKTGYIHGWRDGKWLANTDAVEKPKKKRWWLRG